MHNRRGTDGRAGFVSGSDRENDDLMTAYLAAMKSFWKFRGVCRTYSRLLPGAFMGRPGI